MRYRERPREPESQIARDTDKKQERLMETERKKTENKRGTER